MMNAKFFNRFCIATNSNKILRNIFIFYVGFWCPEWFHDVPEPSAIDFAVTNAQNDGMRSSLDQMLCFFDKFWERVPKGFMEIQRDPKGSERIPRNPKGSVRIRWSEGSSLQDSKFKPWEMLDSLIPGSTWRNPGSLWKIRGSSGRYLVVVSNLGSCPTCKNTWRDLKVGIVVPGW